MPGAGHPRHRRRGPAGGCGRGSRAARAGRSSRSRAGALPARARPVRVNLLLRDFIAPCRPAPRTWTRGRRRGKRALYISSPIGLGHARRDIAIARELRGLQPDLEIDWLAQHPVTAALEAAGERPCTRPAPSSPTSPATWSPSPPSTTFTASRRGGAWTKILVANFMVFDLVSDTDYDLWIADEGWEIDYYLHENPEQKRGMRLADRLRRLAADARRRRARGRAHRRLQRRDDRAHRALPARPRPRDLRRQSGRHRAGRLRPRPAGDRGLDRRPLRLRQLCHRFRSVRARRPRAAACGAGIPARRAGVHRDRGRLRRRPLAPAARDGRLPGSAPSRPRAAHDRRRRAADRPASLRRTTASRSAPSSPTSTATSPPATSPSCRAA